MDEGPQLTATTLTTAATDRGRQPAAGDHACADCDNPSAVVVLNQGQTTTASDILAIAGVAAPTFTMAQPLSLVGCFIGATAAAPSRSTIGAGPSP